MKHKEAIIAATINIATQISKQDITGRIEGTNRLTSLPSTANYFNIHKPLGEWSL